ncbi:propionyl-CoA synthetase [Alphaproteobacteria bacterium]|nr:propionyl-CoA synthetase [Alphaproteobacteria bacterium]
MESYKKIYQSWKEDQLKFWHKQSEGIDWEKKPQKILDDSNLPFYKWFPDGRLNTCYNAIDRHVLSGKGNQTAIIYDSPVTNIKKKISYKQLQGQIIQFSGALKKLGVSKGDRVIIYMPMIPEAIIAMLACARIGAIHSVVFGGFASTELATRIDDCQPKLIISASCGHEVNKIIKYKPLLDKAVELAKHKVEKCIIFQREAHQAPLNTGQDIDWNAAIKNVSSPEPLAVEANHPLYILYTSGTTGKPKGVVRDNGGHAVSLNWSMKNIYDVEPGDVYWAASDIGWVVGHSYIVYAPLIYGCTSVLFEGKPIGTPNAGTFWRIISEYKVSVLFTAPTALRAVKRDDPNGDFIKKHDLSSLKSLFLAGERADPDTVSWLENKLKIPIIDHWWQTETGWPVASNPMGIEALPIKKGSPTVAMPGYNINVLSEDKIEVERGSLGAISIKLPLPPGSLPTLWNADERYIESYLTSFPGYYETGDAGYQDEDGYLYIMSRTDDVINVAGHRLSTGAMEEVLSNHQDVAECAVIGVSDELKGQVPMGLVCLNKGCNKSYETISKEIIALVRNEIGPVASFKLVAIVPALPKTRSGKILRSTIRKIADKTEWEMPATVDDPMVFQDIEKAIDTLR